MNAPWSPSRGGSRDPFAAYVCDDQTADILRPVCAEQGWPAERIYKGGLRNAVQSLSVSASPCILVVDLSESGDPLNDINALAEVCEPGTIVIATGEVNDVRLYRDLVASGIQDYLLKPFSIEQVREAISHAQNVLATPRAEASTDRPHIMVGVMSARGGAGGSTVSTSLAWVMSDIHKRLTSLLDLDVHFGTAALTLDLEPGRGLTDAIDNPARIDGLFIERAMVRASDKLSILSAEAPMNQPFLTDGSAFYQLQEEMRSVFECTVVDLPRNIAVQHPHLVADMQAVVVVTELTLAGARDMIRILAWLKANAPQSQVITVANKVGASGEISPKDFESSIERKVDLTIPFDSKTASHAAKLGKSMAEIGKASKTGATLRELCTRVISIADGEETDHDKPVLAKGKSKAAEAIEKPASKSLFSGFKLKLPMRKEKAAPATQKAQTEAAT